jgi:hypothetical protein
MDGFRQEFGWDCPPSNDDSSCVPRSQHDIDKDQGLINGLFGIGACMYVILQEQVIIQRTTIESEMKDEFC